MNRGRCNSRARASALLFLGLSLGQFCGFASAGDGRWVTQDGRKIGLTRSKTELAVKLRTCDAMDSCARRLDAADMGKLESFKRAPHAQFKILKGSNTDRSQIDRLLQDPAIEEVQSVYRFEGVENAVVGTRSVMVKVNRGLSEPDVRAIWKEFGIVEAVAVKGQRNVYQVGVPDGADELLLAESLADDARTEWAQPNFRREAQQHQITPADQFFSEQWHLNNTGQLGGVSGADIDALEAWSIATGTNVLVGSFDDAFDVDHEDLRDNYIGTGQDITLAETADGYDDPRPKLGDFFGDFFGNRHGTATMGLTVAKANNRGGRGVAFDAKFTASRGLNDLSTDGQTASAYIFARDKNVDVHNNSWGFNGSFPDPAIISDALAVAYATGRNKGDLDGDGDDDPLGMLIFFSSGNEADDAFTGDDQNMPGFSLAALPYVIGVGASDDRDARIPYSNFGPVLSVLAPSGADFRAGLLTTDNSDSSDVDKGYNIGGLSNAGGGFFFVDENGEFIKEADEAGNYTNRFDGTSGSCPIVAGIAALCVSANPNLTATDVRMLIEHTAERIEPQVADYDPITSHSLTHGYGRVNAGGAGEKLGAVEAAQQALSNGGHTWPDRAADVVVDNTTIRWIQGSDTVEFLVVQSDNPFEFIPADGACYDPGQTNCTGEMRSPPGSVSTLAVGCGLACSGGAELCETGAEQCLTLPQGKHMAVYARNALGRYSFGVEFDSSGNVNGAGRFIDLAAVNEVVIPTGPPASRPEVTISVSPLEGKSPLTVNFRGNALSSVPINEARTSWDFDREAPPEIDASVRNASHVYEVADGETRTFIARLTMYDENGTPGSEEVAITVQGQGEDTGVVTSGDLQIVVGLPDTPDSDVSSGKSPFRVVLSVDATALPGNLQAINWDLGDGGTSSSLVVPHTYINEGTVALRIPITATVTTATSLTSTVNTSTTRIITVEPGTAVVDPGDVGPCVLPGTCAGGAGGSARSCGAAGMLPLLLLVSLTWMRRKNG